MISITINDQQFEVSSDLSALEAARENGIHIPTLCYHEDLESVGACRLYRSGGGKSSQGWSRSIWF